MHFFSLVQPLTYGNADVLFSHRHQRGDLRLFLGNRKRISFAGRRTFGDVLKKRNFFGNRERIPFAGRRTFGDVFRNRERILFAEPRTFRDVSPKRNQFLCRVGIRLKSPFRIRDRWSSGEYLLFLHSRDNCFHHRNIGRLDPLLGESLPMNWNGHQHFFDLCELIEVRIKLGAFDPRDFPGSLNPADHLLR